MPCCRQFGGTFCSLACTVVFCCTDQVYAFKTLCAALPCVCIALLQDLEVTVKNVSDSPGGPEEMVASSTATSASEAGGVTTVTSFTPHSKSHMGAATAAGDTQPQPLPDLSKILPADDALVYAGGFCEGSIFQLELNLQ
jgi:hypothetical protein